MRRLAIVYLIALSAFCIPAFSDSWALPSTREYFSENQEYRLTVVPREFERQSAHGKVKTANAGEAVKDVSGGVHAHATLDHMVPERKPVTIWKRALVNTVAPGSALVADSGKYVVTFDNWSRMGRGDDMVVIYGSKGRLIKTFSLVDVIGERRFKALPRSISSIWWSGKHTFSEDGEFVILQIVNSERAYAPSDGKSKTYTAKRIRLRDGRVIDQLTQWVTCGVVFGSFCILLFLLLRWKQAGREYVQ